MYRVYDTYSMFILCLTLPMYSTILLKKETHNVTTKSTMKFSMHWNISPLLGVTAWYILVVHEKPNHLQNSFRMAKLEMKREKRELHVNKKLVNSLVLSHCCSVRTDILVIWIVCCTIFWSLHQNMKNGKYFDWDRK